MGKMSKRNADAQILSIWEKLKKPVKTVYGLMSKEMQQKDFVSLFKYCYPHLWEEIEAFHKRMTFLNSSRIKKNKYEIYCFKEASSFLSQKAEEYQKKAKFPQSTYNEEEKRLEEIEKIRKDSEAKYSTKKEKAKVREQYIQHMSPDYVQSHINVYYDIRKKQPDNIDTRYLIIHELAKYKCDATISFLTILARCEKNIHLKNYAWEMLNNLGVYGIHKGRRKGKKKYSHTKNYMALSTPQELLNAIYNSPLENMKHYDLFLSHSYQDKAKLLELKDNLNKIGLNVFLDWVNDRDELKRTLACKETAAVIAERLLACKAVLYVHTESSLTSKWTPWELGFAYAKNKQICVLDLTDGTGRPEYLDLYEKAYLKENHIYVQIENNQEMEIKKWIKGT